MYPNQGYEYQNYDPNQAYYEQYPDQYYDSGYDEGQEDAELNREQAEKDRLEALESNRLYLKKIRKRCALEDFADLDQKQLLLFEALIESLEVNSESTLGLTPSSENSQVYVTARVQFLNAPYLEISENDKYSDIGYSPSFEKNGYFETVGNAWNSNVNETYSLAPNSPENEHHSFKEEDEKVSVPEIICDVKWESSSGKSCLFSMSALEIILNLDKYPVNIQVNRCVGQTDNGNPESSEPLGYSSIRLPDEFSMSVLQSLKPGVVLPVTNVYQQICDVRNIFGVKKGNLEMSIKLSAFGPVIITSVQSVGSDHHYFFQPGPIISKVDEREQITPRSDLLKPLITEEENTIGLSIMKEFDSFQKPVMWNGGTQNCGCLDTSQSKTSNLRGSEIDCISLLKMPFCSEISLCRDIKSPMERNTLKKFRKDICDWHTLVGSEIKNNPECYCQCFVKESDNCKNKESGILKKLGDIRKSYQPLPPIIGLGLKPDPIDCKCPCPEIKKALKFQTIATTE